MDMGLAEGAEDGLFGGTDFASNSGNGGVLGRSMDWDGLLCECIIGIAEEERENGFPVPDEEADDDEEHDDDEEETEGLLVR